MRRQRSFCARSSACPATPIASQMAACSPSRENRATAQSARGPCPRVRAHRSTSSSSNRRRLSAETDALVISICAYVHNLPEIQAHVPVLAVQLVPAALAERRIEALELHLVHAQCKHLTALEADADVAQSRHQCPPTRSAAGCTISVSTPSVARGCIKAT